MDFFRKLRVIFYKENRKKFSMVKTIIKGVFSLFMIALLPIIFFVIFIFTEPREVIEINKYVFDKIVQSKSINKVSYSSAKITINKHFKLIYIISDLDLYLNDLHLKFPNISFKMNIIDVIKKKFFFDEISIGNLVSYFDYEEDEKNKEVFSYSEVKQYLYKIIDKLYNSTIIFNSLSITNSNFYFADKNTNIVDRFEIIRSNLKLNKEDHNFILDFKITSKINNEYSVFSTNKCKINEEKEVECKSTLYNLYTSNLFKMINKNISNYSENIDGLFNLELNTYFDNYTTIKDSNFKIYSKEGNFIMKDFFKNKIYFKDLVVEGKSKDEDTIDLSYIKAKLSDDNKNYMNFLMSLNFKNNNFLKININLDSANFTKLDTFWPLFFDDKEIRDWVVTSFKSGNINSAFVDIDLLHRNKSFDLNDLKAEVKFNNTLLEYSTMFPQINNIDGKAIFSKNDVLININSGKTLDTKVTDSSVYIDFNKPTVNISINSNGAAGDLLSFIDEKYKNNIFINGLAESKILIDVPIKDNLILDDVYLKIKSNIKNINSTILLNNSNIKLDLLKTYNSNNFNVKLNMDNTYMESPIIYFLKDKDNKLNVSFDVVVINNDIFVKDLIASGDYISFKGNANINENGLSLLELYNIKYDDNYFNIKINGNTINLYGDKINIYYGNKSEVNSDYNLDFKINNLVINKEYSFNFIDFIYNKNRIFLSSTNDNFINIIKDNDKYIISGEIKEFGDFLNYSKINKNIIGGYTVFDGDYYNDSLNLTIKIKNEFSIITTSVKDSYLFRKLLESEILPNKTKNTLKNNNSLTFSDGIAEIVYYDDNILKIKSFALRSKGIFGIGIGGKGKIFIDTGKIDISGAVIPADKLNTLFGLNKVPLISNIIFGGKNGGLFTTGYEFYKKSYKDDYTFKLTPISVSSVNSIKNAFLLLLLL